MLSILKLLLLFGLMTIYLFNIKVLDALSGELQCHRNYSLLILFLGLFVESVDDVEHGVAGYHVVAGFGAALGSDRAVDV